MVRYVLNSPSTREHNLPRICVYDTPADVTIGIRPLVRDPNAKNTESLVRNHLVTLSDSGLLTCAGGKWTTYRQMAEDAVDKAIKAFKVKPRKVTRIPNISGLSSFDDAAILDGTCQTHQVRLIGAHGYSKTLFINLIQHFGLDADVANHLAQSYGDRAWDVAALASPAAKATTYPSRGRKLSPLYPFIDGEVRYAVRSEYAQTAVDVLARRTRLSFLNAQAALEALPQVIEIMGEELQWSPTRREFEWTETVHFLASMGLSKSKLNVTREQVLSGETTAPIEEPCWRKSKYFRLSEGLKLTTIDSPATPSKVAVDLRPGEIIGLQPESPANSYP